MAKDIKSLRLHLHKEFWKDMSQALQIRLDKSAFADRWTIFSDGDRYDEDLRNIKIQVKSLPESFKGSYLTVCLFQDYPPAYQLQYGLLWAIKERSAPDSATFRTLLEKSRIAGVYETKQNSWAPTLNFLNIFPQSDEFILNYSPEFIEKLTANVWDYFATLEPMLFQLNQELFGDKNFK